MSNIEKIENSTKSILLYISSEEGKEVVKKYFKNVSRRGLSDPNYSDMIEILHYLTFLLHYLPYHLHHKYLLVLYHLLQLL